MRTLAILALAALVLALLLGPAQTLAQHSSLPARSPLPNLDECYARCAAETDEDEQCLCRYSCRCKLGMETACQPDDARAACPPRRMAPQRCDRPGWHRMADWMGLYSLWTDGSRYCVEGK